MYTNKERPNPGSFLIFFLPVVRVIPLPAFVRYFRAGKLGEGTFGSVIAVYDAEGSEFAAKVFDDDEEEDDQVCETQSTFNCAAHLIRWLQEHALHLQRWSLKFALNLCHGTRNPCIWI